MHVKLKNEIFEQTEILAVFITKIRMKFPNLIFCIKLFMKRLGTFDQI